MGQNYKIQSVKTKEYLCTVVADTAIATDATETNGVVVTITPALDGSGIIDDAALKSADGLYIKKDDDDLKWTENAVNPQRWRIMRASRNNYVIFLPQGGGNLFWTQADGTHDIKLKPARDITDANQDNAYWKIIVVPLP